MNTKPRIVEVRQNVLKHNDEVARALRQRFQNAGLFVLRKVAGGQRDRSANSRLVLQELNAYFHPIDHSTPPTMARPGIMTPGISS